MSRFSPGFIFPPAAAGPLVLTFKQFTAYDTVLNTTHTFTAVPIGTASADRIVVCGFHSRNNGTGGGVTSVTIGGVTATVAKSLESGNQSASLYYALVPNGTTADITIVYAQTQQNTGLGTWIMTGSATASVKSSAQVGASDNPSTGSLATAVGGVGIALCSRNAIFRTATWTGATSRYNDTNNGAASAQAYGADTTTAGSNQTMSNNLLNDGALSFVGAFFTP